MSSDAEENFRDTKQKKDHARNHQGRRFQVSYSQVYDKRQDHPRRVVGTEDRRHSGRAKVNYEGFCQHNTSPLLFPSSVGKSSFLRQDL